MHVLFLLQLARLFWTILLVVIYVITAKFLSDCRDGWIIFTYLSFSIAMSVLAVICEICIARISIKVIEFCTSCNILKLYLSQGTLVESEGRNGMFVFLNSHIVLGVCQLLCAIWG